MIYGLVLIIVGIISLFVSIKRRNDKDEEDVFDKTNIYGGIIGGVMCIFLGVFIIVNSL